MLLDVLFKLLNTPLLSLKQKILLYKGIIYIKLHIIMQIFYLLFSHPHSFKTWVELCIPHIAKLRREGFLVGRLWTIVYVMQQIQICFFNNKKPTNIVLLNTMLSSKTCGTFFVSFRPCTYVAYLQQCFNFNQLAV